MVSYKKALIIVLLIGFTNISSKAQENTYKYVVYFIDKKGVDFSIEQPDQFMSSKALERRAKFNIPIVENDLPVSPDYLNNLVDLGYEVKGTSNWLNAALIIHDEQIDIVAFDGEDYVKDVTWVSLSRMGGRNELNESNYDNLIIQTRYDEDYGEAAQQIYMLNGDFMHRNGYSGENMTIAVIDAGFKNTNEIEAFDHLRANDRITATYDFVDYDHDVYETSGHGTAVLSTMAGKIEGSFLGTAPDANYILLKSEDINSEQLVEEFNYVLALEYADQMGADLINTSLGYTTFNHSLMNHVPIDLDGDQLIASKGADIAASKGMLVVNSAGNLGDSNWKYISMPADGDSVLAVGAVDIFEERVAFSGQGIPEAQENIKPNIMALGQQAAIINQSGEIAFGNGTSFSGPITTGLVSCLWQAFPDKTNMEIINAVEQSSSQYLSPDYLKGYGIPDFQAAYALLFQDKNEIENLSGINVFPNPFYNNITITLPELTDQDLTINLINDMGQILLSRYESSGNRKTINLEFQGGRGLNSGLYFLEVRTIDNVYMFKVLKV